MDGWGEMHNAGDPEAIRLNEGIVSQVGLVEKWSGPDLEKILSADPSVQDWTCRSLNQRTIFFRSPVERGLMLMLVKYRNAGEGGCRLGGIG
jgi:hypothetical protein